MLRFARHVAAQADRNAVLPAVSRDVANESQHGRMRRIVEGGNRGIIARRCGDILGQVIRADREEGGFFEKLWRNRGGARISVANTANPKIV